MKRAYAKVPPGARETIQRGIAAQKSGLFPNDPDLDEKLRAMAEAWQMLKRLNELILEEDAAGIVDADGYLRLESVA